MQSDYMDNVRYFEELVSCCYPVQFQELSADLEKSDVLPENEELLYYIFRFSEARKNLGAYRKTKNPMPVLISSTGAFLWIAAFRYDAGTCEKIILMGPVFLQKSSFRFIQSRIHTESMPSDIMRRLTTALKKIPVIPSNILFQYALMLHFALTGTRCVVSDIQYEEVLEEDNVENLSNGTTEVPDNPENLQDQTHQGVYFVDQQLLEIVRTGNLNYTGVFDRAALVSRGIRTHQTDTLRSLQDSVIQFIGLCSRAAIQGGLPAPISYSMSDFYTDRTENCVSVSELICLNHSMFRDFVRKVHVWQSDASISRPVKMTRDYISLNLTNDLSLHHLSEMTGCSEYYLSRCFKKETGESLTGYINRRKTEQATVMLKTTSLTIQEISDRLKFTSRSYFSSVFKKYLHCSPREFRMQHEGHQT